MIDKTIPETVCVNIDASGAPYIEDTSDGNCHIGFSYIRADVATSYANEPLEAAVKEAMALLEVLEEDAAYGVLDAALQKHK